MEKANVYVFEDEPKFNELIARRLAPTEHTLVGTATTLESGLQAVTLMASVLMIDVVVLDGNLHQEHSSRNGDDARQIFLAMKSLGLFSKDGTKGVKIISASKNDWWKNNIKAHRDPGKDSLIALPMIIDSLAPDTPWLKRAA